MGDQFWFPDGWVAFDLGLYTSLQVQHTRQIHHTHTTHTHTTHTRHTHDTWGEPREASKNSHLNLEKQATPGG